MYRRKCSLPTPTLACKDGLQMEFDQDTFPTTTAKFKPWKFLNKLRKNSADSIANFQTSFLFKNHNKSRRGSLTVLSDSDSSTKSPLETEFNDMDGIRLTQSHFNGEMGLASITNPNHDNKFYYNQAKRKASLPCINPILSAQSVSVQPFPINLPKQDGSYNQSHEKSQRKLSLKEILPDFDEAVAFGFPSSNPRIATTPTLRLTLTPTCARF